jgi:Spy/CpxP family protein refolding chaperone
MKKSLMPMVMAAAGILGAAGFASAVPEKDGRAEGRRERGRGPERLYSFLGLTAEQRAKVEVLEAAHREQMEPLRAEGRDLHQKLREALKADNPDPATVGSAMIALKQHRESLKTARESYREQLKGQLTAEQRSKLEAWEAVRPGRGGRGFHKFRGAGQGGPGAFEG